MIIQCKYEIQRYSSQKNTQRENKQLTQKACCCQGFKSLLSNEENWARKTESLLSEEITIFFSESDPVATDVNSKASTDISQDQAVFPDWG